MSIEKNENGPSANNEKQCAEVISILPFIQKKTVEEEAEPSPTSTQTLDGLLALTELSTDDIAGTLIARHVYEVDLMPEIDSPMLFDELLMRINAHRELVEQLRDHIQ